MMGIRGLRRFAVAVLLPMTVPLMLAACQTPDSRLYTLAVLPPDAPAATMAGPPRTLGLGTLDLPALIDRPQIVRRVDPNRVEALEFDRWAEPLADGLRATLAGDLAARLPGVSVLPVAGVAPADGAMTLSVTILRLEASAAGKIVLDAQWSLSAKDRSAARRRDTLEATAPSGDPAALVAAMSRAVAAFADRVATAVPR